MTQYPSVRDAKPNPTHIYIAALQALGLAPALITQNVDNLHRKALRVVHDAFRRHGVEPSASLKPSLRLGSSMSDPGTLPTSTKEARGASAVNPILELHGTLARVHCLREGHQQTRDSWQDQLASVNPLWQAEAQWAEETGKCVLLRCSREAADTVVVRGRTRTVMSSCLVPTMPLSTCRIVRRVSLRGRSIPS